MGNTKRLLDGQGFSVESWQLAPRRSPATTAPVSATVGGTARPRLRPSSTTCATRDGTLASYRHPAGTSSRRPAATRSGSCGCRPDDGDEIAAPSPGDKRLRLVRRCVVTDTAPVDVSPRVRCWSVALTRAAACRNQSSSVASAAPGEKTQGRACVVFGRAPGCARWRSRRPSARPRRVRPAMEADFVPGCSR